ncbi:hypothetical protein KIW84_013072 [Lathyrus oleraceus]|uniref:Uncharacterized protein n=1 Tax=Pisum sativum TaxID=3888 RepID=A0A9D5BJB8_PEA|nr:hypothetical protein KIW84_013072 [Pisum sativum]
MENEPVQKLLEPFTKEQLHALVKQAIEKYQDLSENVRQLSDVDLAHRKIFVHGLGWDATAEPPSHTPCSSSFSALPPTATVANHPLYQSSFAQAVVACGNRPKLSSNHNRVATMNHKISNTDVHAWASNYRNNNTSSTFQFGKTEK